MGTLRVGVMVLSPPFAGMDGEAGLDVDLMTAVAEAIGETVQFVPSDGATAFDALAAGDLDCIAGVTVTDGRQRHAAFAPPYLITGQALAVDTARLPGVHGTEDLEGLTIAVQRDNPSRQVAESLVEQGRAAKLKPYDDLPTALSDLSIGRCDAVMALAPTLTELTKRLPAVDVVQKGLSVENIAIAVAGHDRQLLSRISVAQAELEDAGTLQQIRRTWLGNPYADQRLGVH
ncbi:ABC transporter substrate-binding protein [Mycolicibacterium doricum]|uniref:ABC transporter substrate-binding protein n=1 Tax=Mycolicibacterium doricum TaxID=126673 RepID=A0A1X1T4D3_9MYCO|nr:ABC transporter substrate-binding protein [Mycolicibacterium doricum]MCV7269865.1 amino acid ABC transporter substrate-binding protein [Mycolicibacterium doricum]ORV39446.1 ABC transporter substrate-binding protein [Mycolicibacterium doricum]BBZ07512.1 ABC transporter substrate-binding protein [Mycolicibacterium doricum]